MAVSIDIALPGQAETDALAIPVAEPLDSLTGDGARIVDERLGGRLARLAASGDLRAELGRTLVLHLDGELRTPRVILAGLGRREEVDAAAFRSAAGAAAAELSTLGSSLTWLLDESLPIGIADQARALVEGTVLGAYDPARWKTGERRRRPLHQVVIGYGEDAELRAACERAALLAERVNRARDLVNAPPNELNPAQLAEHAAQLADELPHLSAEALGPEAIAELAMGALGAVGGGSHNEPRLIALRYEPPDAPQDRVLGFVGKAITFDTGGISIKPARNMQDMKGDMAGGAAVLEGIGAVAALGSPVRAVAVVAAAENAVGGGSYRPGDILRAANGKTIEITNTDAEGRLVLADALWYARRLGATHVLDLATLTGAMELALGDLYAGLFANDDDWRNAILAAADRSGDLAWALPLHPRYRRYVESDFADLKNSSDLRQAAPALAAEFLREFAGEGPWAHLDMAGPGFLERSRGDELRAAGGTGYGVRLIAELADSLR